MSQNQYPEHLNPFAERKSKSRLKLRDSFREFSKTLRKSFRIKKKDPKENVVEIRHPNGLQPSSFVTGRETWNPALPRSRFQERLTRTYAHSTLLQSNDCPAPNPFDDDEVDEAKVVRRKGKKRAPLPPKSASSQNINEDTLDIPLHRQSKWSLTSFETNSTDNISNYDNESSSIAEKIANFNRDMEKLNDETNNNVIEAKDPVPDLVITCQNNQIDSGKEMEDAHTDYCLQTQNTEQLNGNFSIDTRNTSEQIQETPNIECLCPNEDAADDILDTSEQHLTEHQASSNHYVEEGIISSTNDVENSIHEDTTDDLLDTNKEHSKEHQAFPNNYVEEGIISSINDVENSLQASNDGKFVKTESTDEEINSNNTINYLQCSLGDNKDVGTHETSNDNEALIIDGITNKSQSPKGSIDEIDTTETSVIEDANCNNNENNKPFSYDGIPDIDEDDQFLYNEGKSLYIAGSRDELNMSETYTGRYSLYIRGSRDELNETNNNNGNSRRENMNRKGDSFSPIPKQRKHKVSKESLDGIAK